MEGSHGSPVPRGRATAPDRAAVVVLVHGLWVNPRFLAPLALRLAGHGWRVVRFGYPTMRRDLDANARALSQFLSRLDARTVHLVGHSLGALLVLRTLERHPDTRVGRVVLLGPPYADSYPARTISRTRAGTWLVGRALAQWLAEPRAPASRWPIGVIAGTLAVGLGRVFPGLPRPSDGMVSVAETVVPGSTDRIELPVTHTGMMFSAEVARQIDIFLRNGAFAHDATTSGAGAGAGRRGGGPMA